MSDLNLHIGCFNYDHTRALFDGTVKIDGVDAGFESAGLADQDTNPVTPACREGGGDPRKRSPVAGGRPELAANGVEGTISQGVRECGLRRSRYVGMAKTHLQHVITAVAMNVVRLLAWFAGVPKAQTRLSAFARLASGAC